MPTAAKGALRAHFDRCCVELEWPKDAAFRSPKVQNKKLQEAELGLQKENRNRRAVKIAGGAVGTGISGCRSGSARRRDRSRS